MKTVAIYSLKGGVGKSSIAVNLAAASSRTAPTLLWDLDAQAASTFILRKPGPVRDPRPASARDIFARDIAPRDHALPTGVPGLDLLPADTSLRDLDGFFAGLGKRKRLAKLLAELDGRYAYVLLDCPPGLTETTEQVLRAADLIVVPVIPSPLARRALDEVLAHLDRNGLRAGKPPRGAIMPVFNMVDRRRAMHVAALAADPRWPVVPAASAVELMGVHHAALAAYAPRSPAASALDALWSLVERRLTRDGATSNEVTA